MSNPTANVNTLEEGGWHASSGEAQARSRFCPACGRGIDWDAHSCPYCSWSLERAVDSPIYGEPISGGKRVALYACSLLVPIFGIVVGLLYMDREDGDHRSVGTKCLVIGAVSMLLMPTVAAAILYVMVLGI